MKSNKKIVNIFVVILLFIFIFSNQNYSHAAFNKEINYQGKLTTSAGIAVANGTYNMEFKLYTVSTGGTAIWTETRTTTNRVTVTNGLFSVMLGEVNGLSGVDFNQTLYLGVNIGGTAVSPSWDGEMTPRKKLGAVPAAVESEKSAKSTNIVGGNSTTLLGSVPYQSDVDTTSLVTPNTTATKKFFTMTGTGTNGAVPSWNTVTATDVGLGNVTNESKATMFTSPTFTGTVGAFTMGGNLALGANTITTTNTTLVSNLNADLLDGQHGSYYATSSGYIPYTGGTSNVDLGVHNLTVDTNSLFVNSATHRVGIGTTSPAYKLEVNGDTKVTAGTLFLDTPLPAQSGYNVKNLTLTSDPFFNQAIIGYDYDMLVNADKKYTVTLGGGFSGSSASLFDANTGSSVISTVGNVGTIEVNLGNMQHYFYGLVLTSPWGTGYGFSTSFLIEKYYDPSSVNGWDSNCDNSEGDLVWGTVVDVTGFSGTQYVTRNGLGNGICKIRVTFRDVSGTTNTIQVGDLSMYQFYYGYKGLSAKTMSDTIFGSYDFSDGTIRTHIDGTSTGSSYFNGGSVGIKTASPSTPLDVVGRGVFGSKASSRSSYGNTLTLANETATDTSLFLWQNGIASGHIGFSSSSNVLRIVNSTTDGLITNPSGIFLLSGGNVGIGTTAPASLLQLHTVAGSNPTFSMSDADVTHGMTTLLPTDQLFKIQNLAGAAGGAWLTGASDIGSISGIDLHGVIGSNDPTDSVPAVLITGSKKDAGTSYTAMGALETVFQIETGAATAGTKLMTILGNGNVGIGTTAPNAPLHVKGTGSYISRFEGTTANNWNEFKSTAGTGEYGIVSDALYFQALDTLSGGIQFWSNSAGNIAIQAMANNNVSLAQTAGNVGIGTTTPAYKLEVKGTAVADAIRSHMGYDIYNVPDPIAPTGVVGAGGSVDTGTHYYWVSYTTAAGETHLSPASAVVTTTAGNNTVTLTIPVSSDLRVTGRKIYRTKAGENPTFQEYYVGVVANNTATSYVDSVADSTLTVYQTGINRINNTSNAITVDGVKSFTVDTKGTFIGANAGLSYVGAGNPTLIGTDAGRSLTTGGNNTFIGASSGYYTTTGLGNTAIGYGNLNQNSTGTMNVAIGYNALSSQLSTGSIGIGYRPLGNNSGNYNVGIGSEAGMFIANGTTPTTGTTQSLYLGSATKASAINMTNENVIGYNATGNGNNSFTLGNDSITKTILKGNVGIGITSPISAVHIVGVNPYLSLQANDYVSGNNSGIRFKTSANLGNIFFKGGVFYTSSGDGSGRGNIVFGQNNIADSSNIDPLAATQQAMVIQPGGNVGIGTTSPTAVLHLKAGTATLNTAPLKFTSGTNLTTAETGAMEYDGTNLYFTPTGTTRKTFAYTTDLTGGYIPYTGGTSNVDLGIHNLTVDTNSLFVDATNHRVGIGTITPGYKLDVLGTTAYPVQIKGVAGGGLILGEYNNEWGGFWASSVTPSVTNWALISSFRGTAINAPSTTPLTFSINASEKMRVDSGGNVGIGTTAPTYKLEVAGTAATDAIRTQIGLDFYQVPTPASLTGIVGAGGSVDTGDHIYYVTYTTAIGMTQSRASSTITTTAGNNTVTLTIPVSTDARVTGRKIYRTKAGAAAGSEYLIATIANNTATTYVDTVADSTLVGSAGLAYFAPNTTNNQMTINGTKAMLVDSNGTLFGLSAGASNTGARNTFLGYTAGFSNTSASYSTIVGHGAGYYQTGGLNTIVGSYALYNTASGSANNAFGFQAGSGNVGGSNNQFFGSSAGRYITGGSVANTTPNQSIFIGTNTKALADSQTNQIVIGYNATGLGSNSVVLGNDSITTTALKGNVGIGTTSPTSLLALDGTAARTIQMERNTIAGTGGQGLTISSGGAIAGLGVPDLMGGDLNLKSGISTGAGTSALRFFTATAGSTGTTDNTPTEKMTILGDGKVGIGATTPTATLHIATETGSTNLILQSAGTGRPGISSKASRGTVSLPTATQVNDMLLFFGGNGYGTTGYSASSNSAVVLYAEENFTDTAMGSAMYFGTTPIGTTVRVKQMTLTSGGNLGIGTSSPTSLLALSGTAARTIQMERNTTAATAGQGLTLSSGGAIAGTANLAGGDLNLKSGISTGTGTSSLRFFTATAGTTGTTDNTPTEKMTILGNGYVGINDVTPDGTLDIDSTITTGIDFGITNTGIYTGTGIVNITANSATTGTVGLITANGLSSGSILSLSSNGTAGLTNQKGLNIALSGTNATSAQTTYGAYISNTHAGTTSTNVGLYASATGGTTANYAAQLNGDLSFTTGANRTISVLSGTTQANTNLTISAGLSTDDTGGNLYLKGGESQWAVGQTGGSVFIKGGAGDNLGGPGDVYIDGGHTGTWKGSVYIATESALGGGLVFIGGVDTYIYRSAANTLALGSGDSFNITSATMYLSSANTTQTGTASAFAGDFNSLTTGTGMNLASSSLSSGSLVNLAVTSTAAASNTQKGLNIALSGTNATSAQTTYGAYISNTHAGTTSTNVGLYVTASGGTTANYAAIFANGNVGIGTTSPTAVLHLKAGTASANTAPLKFTSGTLLTTPEAGTLQYLTDTFYITGTDKLNVASTSTLPTVQGTTGTGGDLSLRGNGANLTTGRVKVLTQTASTSSGTGAFTVAGGVGITGSLYMGGTIAQVIGLDRNTTAATAGLGLTISGGGAIAGTANLAGGDLNLKSGISTGTGVSNIRFFTATAGTTGTTDRTPTEKMTILGSGNVGIGTITPTAPLHVTNGTNLGYMQFYNSTAGGGGSPAILLQTGSASGSSAGAYMSLQGKLESWVDVVATNNTLGKRYMRFGNGQPADTFSVQLLADNGGSITSTPFSLKNDAPTASFYVNSSGNVGFGTNLPTNKISLDGTAARTIWMERNTTSSTAGQGLTISSGGTFPLTSNGAGGDLNLKSGISTGTGTSDIRFFTAYGISTPTVDNIPTEKMTILGNGNVGIGTISPTSILSLGGTAARTIQMERNTTSLTAGQGLTISSGGAFPTTGDGAGGDLTLKSGISTGTGTSALRFFTASAGLSPLADNTPTEKMVISGNGYVGIGNSFPTTGAISILEIGSSDLGLGLAGPVITLGINNNGGPSGNGAGSINFLSRAGNAGFVWQDVAGNMRINTVAPSNANDTAGTVIGTQTSTRETKQDIEDYTDYTSALSMVTNAPLHTFRYIKEVEGYGPDSPLAKSRIGFIADEVDPAFMVGNAIDQVSVNGILMASIKEMDLKIVDINNFEKENTWRDSLISWFSNASNRITRIFTGEVCLTEAGQEAVCLNRTELQSLKAMLNQQSQNQSASAGSAGTGSTGDTSSNDVVDTAPDATLPDTSNEIVPDAPAEDPVVPAEDSIVPAEVPQEVAPITPVE